MKMQLRNFFAIAKPFRLKKSQKKQILSGFKSQIGNPAFHLGLINVTFIPQQTVLFPAKSWEWSTRCNWPPTTKWQHPLIGRLVFCYVLLSETPSTSGLTSAGPVVRWGLRESRRSQMRCGSASYGWVGQGGFHRSLQCFDSKEDFCRSDGVFLPRMHFLSLWCYGSDWVSKDLDILSTYCQECSTLSLKV